MIARASAALTLLLTFAFPRDSHACAGCRNPNLPTTRIAAVHLGAGELRLSALASLTRLHVIHPAGCRDLANCQEAPPQPVHLHDQRLLPGELRALAEWGITSTWGVEAHLPFRVTHTTVRYTTEAGAPYEPLDRGVHHRNETVSGPGDPWLLGRFAATFRNVMVVGRAGLSLPLGRTEENPFALGAQGVAHQHIQLGNGTWVPVLGLDASRTFGAIQVAAYGQAQFTLYENQQGFRAGDRWFTGAQVGRRLWDGLTGALGMDLLGEGAERWDGVIQQDGNLGRTELLAALSVVQTVGSTALSLAVRVPVYRDVVAGAEGAGRLSSWPIFTLGVSQRLRGL